MVNERGKSEGAACSRHPHESSEMLRELQGDFKNQTLPVGITNYLTELAWNLSRLNSHKNNQEFLVFYIFTTSSFSRILMLEKLRVDLSTNVRAQI